MYSRIKKIEPMGVQIKNTLSYLGLGVGFFTAYSIYIGNPKFYYDVIMPISRIIPPEIAHVLAIKMAKNGLFPKYSNSKFDNLEVNVFGLKFKHPVGMAAGFDKNGEAVCGILESGFSHVEVGTITPKPQEGNPKPRLFRLPIDEAVINRYGFNSDGHEIVYERLKNTKWKDKGIVGVNLGVNKTSENRTEDYIKGIEKFNDIADYLVINVSSPNTPGLRNLQKANVLNDMLKEIEISRKKLKKRTPLLIKISPDESADDLKNICMAITNKQNGIDGVIVTNTTIDRPGHLKSHKTITNETGGLSGVPLRDKSTEVIRTVYKLTNGTIPIIGVGGISTGADAWQKLMAGATLVQLYTSFVYRGPPVIRCILEDLNELKLKVTDKQNCVCT